MDRNEGKKKRNEEQSPRKKFVAQKISLMVRQENEAKGRKLKQFQREN